MLIAAGARPVDLQQALGEGKGRAQPLLQATLLGEALDKAPPATFVVEELARS